MKNQRNKKLSKFTVDWNNETQIVYNNGVNRARNVH